MANDKYIQIITSEHIDKPNFISWLTAGLDKGEGIYSLLCGMDTEFDIDSAVGIQLDTLGTIVGISRNLDFQPTDGSSPILDDDTYRVVLKAKILKNLWDGTIPAMLAIWGNIFSDFDLYITDNQDMSMKAMVVGVSSPLELNLIENGYFLPKPQGVSISYEFADIINNDMKMGLVVHEGTFETINQVI